jgi:hypothetical protein
VKQEAQGSGERVQQRAQERKEQLQPTSSGPTPSGGDTTDLGGSYGSTTR